MIHWYYIFVCIKTSAYAAVRVSLTLSKIQRKIKRYKKTDKQSYRHNYESSKSNSEPTVVFLRNVNTHFIWLIIFVSFFFQKKIPYPQKTTCLQFKNE